MTRKYEVPTEHGSVEIPADLLEVIADDVRNFDRAESPEGRSAFALKKISNELPRVRDAIKYQRYAGDPLLAEIQAVAQAVQVADITGYTSDQIRRAPRVQKVLNWLGINE